MGLPPLVLRARPSAQEQRVRPANRVLDGRGVIPPKGGHTYGPWQSTRCREGTARAALDRPVETQRLGRAAFCARHGPSPARFYGWRRTLQQRDAERTAFVPVHVVA